MEMPRHILFFIRIAVAKNTHISFLFIKDTLVEGRNLCLPVSAISIKPPPASSSLPMFSNNLFCIYKPVANSVEASVVLNSLFPFTNSFHLLLEGVKNRRKFVSQTKKLTKNTIIMKKLLQGLFTPVYKKEMNALADGALEDIANATSEVKERTFTTVDLWSIQRRKKRIAVRRFTYAEI
jgi:hypothetical protein